MLRCEKCGRENPDDNRFCGQCGAALAVPEPMAEPSRTVSGPSFLGLSEPAPYRYEDDEEDTERSSWRAWAVLAVLLVVGGLVWMQWRYSSALHSEPRESDARPSAVQTEETPASPAPEQKEDEAAAEPTPGAAGENSDHDESSAAEDTDSGKRENDATAAGGEDEKAEEAAGPSPVEEQPAEDNEEQLAARLEQERIAKGGGEEPAKSTLAENDADLAIARRALAAGRTEEAVRRLWASTSRGSAVAPVLLAQLYLKGDGVERSCEQALVLLNSAARRENAQARAQLGRMYAEGECTQQDRVAAYHWYTLALNSAPDDDAIRRRREELWNTMTEMEREEARALSR